MTTDLREAIRSLVPLIEEAAESTEIAGTMPTPVAAALRDAGLFDAATPVELGGHGADIATLLDLFEMSAYADGSTGWSLMANVSSTAIAAGFTSDAGAAEMFPAGSPAVAAGMLGPVGVATEEGDGFRVRGNWQFGSGIGNANWVGMGAMVQRDGAPATTESGMPYMLIAFAPRAEIELRDGWDVMGLVGTGSYDYTADTHVPAERTFALLEAQPQRGGATYGLGIMGLTSAGHAGFAIGVGLRALDEVRAIAQQGKSRFGYTPISQQQLFQHDYGYHDAAVRAAKAYVYQVFAEAEATLRSGEPLGFEQAARLRQSGTYATRVAAEAARFAYTWAGSQGLRNPSVVQRCFRDMHAATQHVFVDNNTLTGLTEILLMS